MFLALFSYFVLVDLQESTTSIEYVIWGWTLTMFLEECRQVIEKSVKKQKHAGSRSLWTNIDMSSIDVSLIKLDVLRKCMKFNTAKFERYILILKFCSIA